MSDDPRPIEPPITRPSLRSGGRTDTSQTKGKRFDMFLIDTGWNRSVSQAVREQVVTWPGCTHPSRSTCSATSSRPS